jgi:hypothetical protein
MPSKVGQSVEDEIHRPVHFGHSPRGLSAQSTNILLNANTIFPGDNKSGAVVFSGRCNDYEMHVALTLSNRRVSFQFPSAPEKP